MDAFLSCSCDAFDPTIPLLGIYKQQIITHSTVFSLLFNCPGGRWFLVCLSPSEQRQVRCWALVFQILYPRFPEIYIPLKCVIWNTEKSILSEASALPWLFNALCYLSLKSWIIIRRVSGSASSWVHAKSGVRSSVFKWECSGVIFQWIFDLCS